VSRAKSVVKAQGVALSRELAELVYDVDYYVHVDTPQDAVKLVTHMPYKGHALTTEALNAYVGPVVEQAINQLVQVTRRSTRSPSWSAGMSRTSCPSTESRSTT
jgi:alpha-glucosidase (family GH31 glycosyl hydrolase)